MRFISLILILSVTLWAEIKRELKSNSTVKELVVPQEVDGLNSVLSKGIFYGRLRYNSFMFDWDREVEGKRKDHYTVGVGGSVIYKSTYLNGLGFTAGLYTTQNPMHMDNENVQYYKVGKGVMSRYNIATKGEYGLTSLAQIFLEYKNEQNSLRIGRQIFESHMTKSNDIKMIPNTFEGVTLHSKVVPNHTLKLAYLTKQKLRDHTEFHHLFAYDDGEGTYDKWRQNDDTAMHQGITLSKLREQGIEDQLLLFEIDNGKSSEFGYMFNYTIVPELFASSTLDLSYKWQVSDYTFSPALRYMHQFDHGAGAMGGANLKTNTVGYSAPDSVEANLYGVRLDIAKNDWRIRTGMSRVGDGADIISPWRAFPTNGFGYSLLQYNWYANTNSYLLQGDYDFSRYNLHAQVRYNIQDFDDDKAGVQADSRVVQLDFIKQFNNYPNFYAKLRMVRVYGDDGTQKLDPSYKDIRLEFNYLF